MSNKSCFSEAATLVGILFEENRARELILRKVVLHAHLRVLKLRGKEFRVPVLEDSGCLIGNCSGTLFAGELKQLLRIQSFSLELRLETDAIELSRKNEGKKERKRRKGGWKIVCFCLDL